VTAVSAEPEDTATASGDRPSGPGERPARRRPVELVELLALAMGLLPLVTVLVWALVTGWVPLGDSGQLTVRSRDVFTANHPFVGAWSSRSASIDGDVNNLGSLQLVLLAPFTRLDPYWGSALGAAVLGAGAVAGVWASARSVFGRWGAVGSMLATLVLIATLGNVPLLETRQQLAMLLPFWCLLWATVAFWHGRAWAAPLVVLTASLVVQTHFTFIVQAMAVAAAGTVAFAFGARRRWRQPGTWRPLLFAGAVGLVSWAPTVWDQFFGRGNLGQVAGQPGATGGGPGLGLGVQLVSDFTLARPFWMPGSMGRSELGTPVMAWSVQVDSTSWLTVGAWALLVVATWAWAWVGGRSAIAALAGVAGVALGSAIGAATLIPPAVFAAYAPQNYYWAWPVAMLLALVPIAALATMLWPITGSPAYRRRIVNSGLVVVLLAAGAGGSVVTNRLASLSRESFEQQAAGRSFVKQLAASLDADPIEGRVLIRYEGMTFNSHNYLFIAELQRRGIDFTYAPGDGNLFRFGPRRCADPSVRQEITFTPRATSADERPPGAVVLARINSSPARRAELDRLDRRAADAMRSGAIAIDLDKLKQPSADAVSGVLANRRRSAAGLASTVASLSTKDGSGIEVSTGTRPLVAEWLRAAKRVSADQATLTLTRRSAQSRGVCP